MPHTASKAVLAACRDKAAGFPGGTLRFSGFIALKNLQNSRICYARMYWLFGPPVCYVATGFSSQADASGTVSAAGNLGNGEGVEA